MKIGLIDVDSHNFPNLPLMKISAWHKKRGDDVEWYFALEPHYDRVYISKIFTATKDVETPWNAAEVVRGGTGYDIENKLPFDIEHIYPDYSLYPKYTKDTAYGFLTRGCPRNCGFCIVSRKEGKISRKVADLSEWWHGQKNIVLLDPNILACRQHEELLGQLAESNSHVDFTQGLDARLLTEKNISLINAIKVKNIHFAWDFMEQSESVKNGLQLFKRLSNKKFHGNYGMVYVLTNYDTSEEENLHRIYWLRDNGFDPYVMIYDKQNAPKETRYLQRWCNNKIIFGKVKDFKQYNHKIG